jgi:transcriptional regulator with XRE-family HTH domain
MDCEKVGLVIKKLRKEKGYTQNKIAEIMNISDKTVSKWERGLGCPDVNFLNELANILGTAVENILGGNVDISAPNNGNMKNIRFYICKNCGNIITSFDEMAVYCCGRKIDGNLPVKAEPIEKLMVENIENEWFVSSDREMSKNNYVLFVAYLTSDKMLMTKLYPEWNLQTRFFNYGHGRLVWGTNKGELLYQLI